MDKERIIQEFVPGKQGHTGASHRASRWKIRKIGVPDAGAIGIMTLTPAKRR